MLQFDQVLSRLGDFRLYQWYQYVLLGLSSVPTGVFTLANVFLLYIPDVYCNVPGLENLTLTDRQMVSSPYDPDTLSYNYCEVYDVDYTSLDVGSLLNFNKTLQHNSTRQCTSWTYAGGVYTDSIVARYDLICGSAWKRAVAQSIYMLGFLFGCIGLGALADRFGRKTMLMMATLILCLSGLTAAFVPNFWAWVAIRHVSGIAAAGCITCSFVLSMETIGKPKRMVPGIFFQGWFAMGMCMVSVMAYFIRQHFYLQIAISMAPLVCLIEYWFIGKSARWLLTQGRVAEAVVEVKKAARVNGVEYPADIMPTPGDKLIKETKQNDRRQKKNTVFDLIRSRALRWISINVFYNWFVNSFVYYGLSMGVSELAGSPFVNLFIFGILEFPGYIICTLTLDRIGRPIPLAALMITGGLACISMLAVPDEYLWLRTSFAMLGKLTISGSFAHIYVYSAELFPTTVRNVGVGAGSMHARIGGLVAPFVAELGRLVWWPLPGIIFGSTSLVAGLLALLLPETLNKSLPETMEDAERWRSRGLPCFSRTGEKDNATREDIGEKSKALLPTNGYALHHRAEVA